MKSQAIRVALFSVVLLATSAFFASAAEQAKEHQLTRQEVKALIVNAKTPEDNLKLASYYRDEARQQEAKAKYHDEMGELYRQHPLPNEGKMPYRMADHCKSFADSARKAAEAANAMADEQEKLAAQLREQK